MECECRQRIKTVHVLIHSQPLSPAQHKKPAYYVTNVMHYAQRMLDSLRSTHLAMRAVMGSGLIILLLPVPGARVAAGMQRLRGTGGLDRVRVKLCALLQRAEANEVASICTINELSIIVGELRQRACAGVGCKKG